MSTWYRAYIYVPRVPQRYVMCALAVLGSMLGWMMYYSGYRTFRELVTNAYEHTLIPRSFVLGRCFNEPIPTDMKSKQFVKVYWSHTLQRSVKQVFWLGCAMSSVAIGLLVDVVGPRRVWGLGSVLTCLTCAVLPAMAKTSPQATLCTLLFTGFGFGVLNPCSSVVAAHWAPESERTFFVACVEASGFLGLILAVALHDGIHLSDRRWEYWLYVGCVLNLLWVSVWYILFYNRPSEHLHISTKESQYLKMTTEGVQPLEHAFGKTSQVGVVPWRQILLSPAFLSLQLFNFATCWSQSLLLYTMKTYVVNIFGNSSGTFPSADSMPFQSMAVGIAVVSVVLHGWVSDKLISTGLTGRTPNRRFFIVVPSFICGSLVFVIPFLGCSRDWVVVVFYAMIYFQGMGFAVAAANVVDLSPRYAGLLRGLLAAGQALAYIFHRQLVNILVQDASDRNSWNVIFQTSAAVIIIPSIPYLFFGSGKIQKWNYFCKTKLTRNDPVRPIEESPEATGGLQT